MVGLATHSHYGYVDGLVGLSCFAADFVRLYCVRSFIRRSIFVARRRLECICGKGLQMVVDRLGTRQGAAVDVYNPMGPMVKYSSR